MPEHSKVSEAGGVESELTAEPTEKWSRAKSFGSHDLVASCVASDCLTCARGTACNEGELGGGFPRAGNFDGM